MAAKAVTLLLLCVWCVEESVCFSNGSVAFSCGSMMPGHPPFIPSNTSPPYKLFTSSATYSPGGLITVTVEVLGNSSFQGFLLQARSWEGQAGGALVWPVGKFVNINSTLFTALPCENIENSTVSQASSAPKKKVQLTWEAPRNSTYEKIYFSASIVQDYTTFWVQVNSSSVTLERAGRPSHSAAGVSSSLTGLLTTLLCLAACF